MMTYKSFTEFEEEKIVNSKTIAILRNANTFIENMEYYIWNIYGIIEYRCLEIEEGINREFHFLPQRYLL